MAEQRTITDDLDVLFPGHRSLTAAAKWEALKIHFPINCEVTGTVVMKSPFGAWLDLGVGFPALLQIITIEGMTPEKYAAGDWCPIGSKVTATFTGFDDYKRQLCLRQKVINWH